MFYLIRVPPDIRPGRINPVIRPPIADPAGSPDLEVDPAGLPDFFQILAVMTFTARNIVKIQLFFKLDV